MEGGEGEGEGGTGGEGGILDIILTWGRVEGGTGGEGGILDIILTHGGVGWRGAVLTSFVKVVSGSKSDAGFETRSKCVNS